MDTTALGIGPATPASRSRARFTEAELASIWRTKILNLKRSWREFEAGETALESMPSKAIVELTQNCNFKCIMCPQSWEDKFRRFDPALNMPMETFTRIADELFPWAIFIDLRGFGETTILPWWPDVVEYLERFPYVEWHLVTNLALPRDDLWTRMIGLGFTLGASIDGATAETFETIRRGARFDRIRHNLGVVRDAIAGTRRGYLYFISTIQKKNLHEMAAILRLAAEFGVYDVQFKIVQEGGHDEGLSDVPREVVSRHVADALDAAVELELHATFNDWLFTRDADPLAVARAARPRLRKTEYPLPPAPSFDPWMWQEEGFEDVIQKVVDSSRVSVHQRCFKPYSYTYVSYDARMGTCNHMMYPDMVVMGDLRTEAVADVWNSPRYREFRAELRQGKPTDTRCQWCFKHRLDD